MISLNNYRDENGRINLNTADLDRVIKIDRKPYTVGARPKLWCECNGGQPDILFKETLTNNYEDIAEIIGYEIAKKMGLNCAEYDFAVFDGRNGVITSDFIGENEELINGGEILDFVSESYIKPIINSINEYNEIVNENHHDQIDLLIDAYYNCPIKSQVIDNLILNRSDDSTLKKYLDDFFQEISLMYEYNFKNWNKKKTDYVSNNLMDIWSMLDNYCKLKDYKYEKDSNIMLDLIKMFFYDILVNQGDRHIKGNWGIILNHKTKEIRLAPIYDNSKICGLHNSKEIIRQRAQQIVSFEKMDKEQNPRRYTAAENQIKSLSNKTQSKLMIDYDDVLNNTDKFEMLKKLIYVSDNETFELIRELFSTIQNYTINRIIDDVETNYKFKISDDVKIVLLKTTEINMEKIETIILEKENDLNEQNGKHRN